MARKYRSRNNIYEEKVGNRISYKVSLNGTTKRFKDKSEARKYVLEQKLNKELENESPEKYYTYSKMAELLMKDNLKERKYSTYEKKNSMLEKIILPNFVDKPIVEITRQDCFDFRDYIGGLDYSTVYKNNILVVFKEVFHFAEENYDIDNRYVNKVKKFNLTDKEKLEREQKSQNVWSPEEFQQFIECVSGFKFKTFFTLSICSWTRFGETLSLKWSDYDGKTIKVHESISKINKRMAERCFIESTTKSKNGVRKMYLPEGVCKMLDQLKQKQMTIDGFDEDWFIFNRWDGKKYLDGNWPMARTTINTHFKNAIKASGVREIRIHDLRHSGATHAIISGEDIKAVSERLGHGKIDITLDTYHHAIDETKIKLMNNTADFARILPDK